MGFFSRTFLVIISAVLAAFLGASVYFSYSLTRLYKETQKNLRQNEQDILEINYRFEKDRKRLSEENSSLTEFLKKKEEDLVLHEKLIKEQRRIISLQGKISEEQQNRLDDLTGRINGLQNELGGTKSEIELLKKLGGEPLPKDFINSLLQATARIKCFISRTGRTENFRAGSGSLLGKYLSIGGGVAVMTNAHVLAINEDTGVPQCEVVFGENIYYKASVVRKVFEKEFDFAFLKLGEPRDASTAMIPVTYEDLNVGFCEFKDVEVGDRITILSFPLFQGPSHAVSEGYITGIADGPIYEASAIIDNGSSGGVAILNKKRCVLGMPTWKGIGGRLGLSYIQSWPMMLSYK